MTKTEVNKIIETQIFGKCWHEMEGRDGGGPYLCKHCGAHGNQCGDNPDYTGDANQARKVLESLGAIDISLYDGEWECELIDDLPFVTTAHHQNFCLAIATAALRTLGITDDIEE